jgi:hypothetical protein
LPTGTEIGAPVLLTMHAAAQAVGGAQRDGAHHAVAELLLRLRASGCRCRRVFEARRRCSGIASRGNSTSTTAPMH